jgi:pimeloyl-ACP methyl ester carboxylesterase
MAAIVERTFTEAETSNYAQVGELKIHYNDTKTDGSVVICLHGAGPGASSWSNFIRNVDALATQHRVILADMPLFGKSDDPKVFDPNLNVNVTLGLMDALGIDKASFIGNSAGGSTALNIAAEHPDRVLKVVPMGPGGGASNFVPQPTEGIKAIMAGHQNPSLETMRRLANVMLYDGSKISDEALLARVEVAKRHQEARREFQEQGRRSGGGFTGRFTGPDHDYSAITCPVLLVWGREDRVNPLDSGLSLLRMIRTANMYIFNNCGHWAQFEHADEFNKLMLSFFE